ncbi:MAG TPA: antibiotic biosynthesis monooxygenase family protein [Ardenticatenaceae bacterium]|jgi:heme-degrading monooxygenase HmoA
MIVVISRIRVTSGNADALAEQYRSRSHLAETVPGCLGVEVLRGLDQPDEFMVYTRWTDRAAYEHYRKDGAFREAHSRIQNISGGLKIAREERSVDWYEVLS